MKRSFSMAMHQENKYIIKKNDPLSNYYPTKIMTKILFDQKKKDKEIKEGNNLVEVESAFGGAALYKIKYLLNPKIVYDGSKTCEHVAFHSSLKKVNPSVKFYICSQWCCDAQPEHRHF